MACFEWIKTAIITKPGAKDGARLQFIAKTLKNSLEPLLKYPLLYHGHFFKRSYPLR
ncbi:hypothetical protein GJA_1576 [Janthinobacterium agaricidamnosum NBRC 102515 = DSM 9628]|uniref:Uncharacterized protein n=1 Tax=Janthinobacterium agaricidamnosum NBRC 102515 = DSM 9628 TaxID=1349767 RepID=W0V2W7_9BURK|nr:hypothetical protein GJA_1576 [Janthinobacterium agaricidamnosum NBRC 102515 = DSM 9628]